MRAEPLSNANAEAFEKTLTAAIASARSLDEIETWLKSQPCIRSAHLADYILKSNPPQRDFTLEIGMGDGSTINKVATVFDLGGQRFQFHQVRDR